MKKIVAFMAIALAAVSLASAKGIAVGVHGYLGEGWGSAYADTDSQPQKPFGENLYFGGGAYFSYGFKSALAIQPEVNFRVNNIGSRSSVTVPLVGTTTTTTRWTYNSVDIPVLLTYQYKKFNLLIGPYISIPVSGLSSTTTIERSSGSSTGSGTVTDTLSGVTFGATVGLEYAMRMGPGRLVIGGRYFHDFNPVKYETTDGEGNKSTTNYFYRGAAEVTVGFQMAF